MSAERDALRALVAGIAPLDEREAADRADVLSWIDSGAELYRRVPPADPPKHLVAYFLPYDADTDAVFLVAHRKAGRWLPPGGHVDSGEPAWDTVVREADEELGIVARPHPLAPDRRPLFVTVGRTLGPHSHLDCGLWFLLAVEPARAMRPDPGEFSDWRWYPRREVADRPTGWTVPELPRMLHKLAELRRTV